MWQKKITDFYRSTKFEIKYFIREFPLKKKIQNFCANKKNELYKKQYNFILAPYFMQQFGLGIVEKSVLDCKTDLYNFENVYLSCFNECAFVHKYADDKMYTFKESAGIVKRLDAPEMRYAKPLNLQKNVVEEDEICLVCFMLGSNYWHFTCDILPKIMIMERLGYKGKYLLNSEGCVKEFMELLGFSEERLIYSQNAQVIHAKKVHMFDESYGIQLEGKWLSDTRDFIMERIEQNKGKLHDEKYPKKIYISRIGTRRIINENEIIDYLVTKGFEIIVPEKNSIYEQIKLFANADIIVNPHGANCTNILYSKKGTSFVECFGHNWVNPCMIGTMELLDLDYRMICERFADYFPDANKYSNYVINITIFKCLMNKVFEFRDVKIS